MHNTATRRIFYAITAGSVPKCKIHVEILSCKTQDIWGSSAHCRLQSTDLSDYNVAYKSQDNPESLS
jgi:hypothetical protein